MSDEVCASRRGAAFQLGGDTSLTHESRATREIAKTASLPTDMPSPSLSFNSANFMVTGKCIFGTRKQCEEEIDSLDCGIQAW